MTWLRTMSTDLLTDGCQLREGLALVLVRVPPEQASENILYAELDAPVQPVGLVKNLGPPERTRKGIPILWEVEEHDWVIFEGRAARLWQTEEGDLLALMRREDILAVIETDARS